MLAHFPLSEGIETALCPGPYDDSVTAILVFMFTIVAIFSYLVQGSYELFNRLLMFLCPLLECHSIIYIVHFWAKVAIKFTHDNVKGIFF